MSLREISTAECDGCSKKLTSAAQRYSTHLPLGWAEINFEVENDEAGAPRKWEEWHLCPECNGELLGAIIRKRCKPAEQGQQA